MKENNTLTFINIETVRKLKGIFLKFAVWILIGEFIFGAFLILTQSWDVTIGKIQGTFLAIAFK